MHEMRQSSKGAAKFREALAKLHDCRGLQALRSSSLESMQNRGIYAACLRFSTPIFRKPEYHS
jgi:hypothetical protein